MLWKKEGNKVDLWFSEFHTPHVKLSIQVSRHVYQEVSAFQQIDVFDTPEFGRILIAISLILSAKSCA